MCFWKFLQLMHPSNIYWNKIIDIDRIIINGIVSDKKILQFILIPTKYHNLCWTLLRSSNNKSLCKQIKRYKFLMSFITFHWKAFCWRQKKFSYTSGRFWKYSKHVFIYSLDKPFRGGKSFDVMTFRIFVIKENLLSMSSSGIE